jgi:hypothetical protein
VLSSQGLEVLIPIPSPAIQQSITSDLFPDELAQSARHAVSAHVRIERRDDLITPRLQQTGQRRRLLNRTSRRRRDEPYPA